MNEKRYQVFAHYDGDPDHEFHLVLSPDGTVNWKCRAAAHAFCAPGVTTRVVRVPAPRPSLANRLAEAEVRGRQAGQADVIAAWDGYVCCKDNRPFRDIVDGFRGGAPTPPLDTEAIRRDERVAIGRWLQVARGIAEIRPGIDALLRGEHP